jgi:hypothetical protein
MTCSGDALRRSGEAEDPSEELEGSVDGVGAFAEGIVETAVIIIVAYSFERSLDVADVNDAASGHQDLTEMIEDVLAVLVLRAGSSCGRAMREVAQLLRAYAKSP